MHVFTSGRPEISDAWITFISLLPLLAIDVQIEILIQIQEYVQPASELLAPTQCIPDHPVAQSYMLQSAIYSN